MSNAKNPADESQNSPAAPPQCTCIQNPFAALPPELRPRSDSRPGGLRKVTCLGCGLVYWTNRATDLCIECERKGVRLSESPIAQEEAKNA